MRIKKIKSPCCSPVIKLPVSKGRPTCCAGTNPVPSDNLTSPQAETATTELTISDRINAVKCRLGGFRMSYIVKPGLYAVGRPAPESDVFVSANYKLSFDILRTSLKGMDAWLLVLDTMGINVWCAAGKGTFGTDELIKRIYESRLHEAVNHRRIILPQLGGPGVAGHLVQKQTGFKVLWGPVDARNIHGYIEAGYKATKEMRAVEFNALDRLKLTPMELIPAMKFYGLYAIATILFFAFKSSGISIEDGLTDGWPFLALGAVAVITGAVLTPLLLPYMPSRSFALKGWLAGLAATAIAARFTGIYDMHIALIAMTFLLFPVFSSYVALQFTGSTTYTGQSGVKKELSYAAPVYLTATGLSAILLAAFKLLERGVL